MTLLMSKIPEKNIDDQTLILDDKSPTIIYDSLKENFDLQRFKKELEQNEKHLNDLKDQGFLKKNWNAISGKNTSLIIQSLDLNNQFIKFSTYINGFLTVNAQKIAENQNILAAANKKIIDNQNMISSTDENLKIATERFNATSDKLKAILTDLDILNKTKDELSDSISSIKENLNSIESDISGKVKLFYENTDKAFKELDEQIKNNDSHLENIISDINKQISDTLKESKSINIKLKWLSISFLLSLIIIGSLFYYL